jgi:23S rRNA (cytidine1920-2'-O)/16S rRNA (cytidine1409-2'-O)-methyltransferase
MRLDKYLVDKKFFSSRARAKESIERGEVAVDGKPITAPDTDVSEMADVEVSGSFPWVSRGALKLIAALDEWKIDPAGLAVLDLGASTGGFVQVLLSRGVGKVYAVDVGHGQLHEKLKNDSRVVNMEGVDARDLTAGQFPSLFRLVVGDLSFISLSKVLPTMRSLMSSEGEAVLLVKPQFEVGAGATKKGIVREESKRGEALQGVMEAAKGSGFSIKGYMTSPVTGGSGNLEYLLFLDVHK